MLAKPGSGGGGGRLRATASNRRKTAESPDDAIRKLSKQAANKRCADCTTKVRECMTTRGRHRTVRADRAPSGDGSSGGAARMAMRTIADTAAVWFTMPFLSLQFAVHIHAQQLFAQ